MTPDPALWPALAVAGLGAFLDVRERRLPNWLCGALAVLAPLGLALSAGPAQVPWSLLHAALALGIGMVLYRLGGIGGGDAKFYASAAAAVPVGNALSLLGWTSVAGLVLLVAMVAGRRLTKGPQGRQSLRGWSVPYGAAIFAGFAMTLLRT